MKVLLPSFAHQRPAHSFFSRSESRVPGISQTLRKQLVGEAVLGFVKGGGADLHAGVLAQVLGDGAVYALRVDLARGVAAVLLVPVFVPDGYAYSVRHDACPFVAAVDSASMISRPRADES